MTLLLSRVAHAYRRLGLLIWLSFGSLLIVGLIHHASRLPRSYTWFEPLWTLCTVLGRPHFPLAVVSVYALGAWSRRGMWDVESSARAVARSGSLREFISLTLLPLSCVAGVVSIDWLVLSSGRDVWDLFALAALGIFLSAQRPSRTELARELGYGALSASVFLIVSYGYTVLKALTFSTGRGFDAAIVDLETVLFGAPPHRALALWTAAHPAAARLFDWAYFHFFEHMALITVLLFALRRRAQRTEYLAALALCYLLGGPLYQLFPALGPSFFEPHYYEYLQNPQLLSGDIRHFLQANTNAALNGSAHQIRTWGYIACMPSLHIAHELVMLYYARVNVIAFLLSLLFAVLTLVSVIALGWHYPLDSVLGAVVAFTAIAIARSQRRVLVPPELASFDEASPPPGTAVLRRFFQAFVAARREQGSGAAPRRPE